MRTLLIVFIISGCILGYGYWHAATHASLYVQLDFEDETGETSKNIPATELAIMDAEGHVLAHGVSDEQYNYIHLIHPEVGDCHEAEKSATTAGGDRNAWQVCFEQLSTWTATWVDKVHQVDLKTTHCTWRNIPVTITEGHSDWFLWWVPHPHIGGKPYSYYSLYIAVENDHCGKQR